jgi:hypothetical protein
MKSPSARLRRTVVGTVLLGLTLTACGHADPGVAAYVGTEQVSQAQVDQAVKGLGSLAQAGQSVSVAAVVNALIGGELAAQIAAEKNIQITPADRDKVLKGTNVASLVAVPEAQPVVYGLADQAIVTQKLGQTAYLDEVKKWTVTLNPRYGVLDPARKAILADQSGSLSVPAPNASVAAP